MKKILLIIPFLFGIIFAVPAFADGVDDTLLGADSRSGNNQCSNLDDNTVLCWRNTGGSTGQSLDCKEKNTNCTKQSNGADYAVCQETLMSKTTGETKLRCTAKRCKKDYYLWVSSRNVKNPTSYEDYKSEGVCIHKSWCDVHTCQTCNEKTLHTFTWHGQNATDEICYDKTKLETPKTKPAIYKISYVYVEDVDATNYPGAPTTYTFGIGATIDGQPTRDGHTFVSWCKDASLKDCNTTQTITNTDSGDKTFYAKWEQKQTEPKKCFLTFTGDTMIYDDINYAISAKKESIKEYPNLVTSGETPDIASKYIKNDDSAIATKHSLFDLESINGKPLTQKQKEIINDKTVLALKFTCENEDLQAIEFFEETIPTCDLKFKTKDGIKKVPGVYTATSAYQGTSTYDALNPQSPDNPVSEYRDTNSSAFLENVTKTDSDVPHLFDLIEITQHDKDTVKIIRIDSIPDDAGAIKFTCGELPTAIDKKPDTKPKACKLAFTGTGGIDKVIDNVMFAQSAKKTVAQDKYNELNQGANPDITSLYKDYQNAYIKQNVDTEADNYHQDIPHLFDLIKIDGVPLPKSKRTELQSAGYIEFKCDSDEQLTIEAPIITGTVSCTSEFGCKTTTIFEQLDPYLDEYFVKSSVWKDAEGNFNTARLASDSIAGVVVGTIGGVITSNIVKKNQIKKGFESLKCTISGQDIATYGDNFEIGLQ